MARQAKPNGRPPIILRETDAERLSNLASQMEAKAPLAASLLLDEIAPRSGPTTWSPTVSSACNRSSSSSTAPMTSGKR